MKKGFTMIELIFVIVILGILAAVAIPRLAATRNDAKAATMKTDINTAMQAIPAWFQGQKEASFLHAMSLDTTVWAKTPGSTNACEYTYTDGAGDTVGMAIHEGNTSSTGVLTDLGIINTCDDSNVSALGNSPYLSVVLNTLVGHGVDIVGTLETMGVHDANVTLAGTKVKW